jgi:hypothetical protein
MNIKSIEVGHLVTVENNEVGRAFVKVLRQSLRGTNRRVTLCGRGYRYGYGNYHKADRVLNGKTISKYDNRYQSCLPLPIAQKWAVYVHYK